MKPTVAPFPKARLRRTRIIPGMRALAKFALGTTPATYSATVTGLSSRSGWWLEFKEVSPAGPFDAVSITVPAPQLPPILCPHAPDLAASATTAIYDPCLALMLAFEDELAKRLDHLAHDARLADGVEWLAYDGGKPGRRGATMVVHASGTWTPPRLEEAREDIGSLMTEIVRQRLDLPEPLFQSAHRWRFSRVAQKAEPGTLYDGDAKIGIAGDWCAGPNVEAAFMSGLECAESLLAARG